jgi:Rrf2 family nitric oxide-sensitive transcriptional repressor
MPLSTSWGGLKLEREAAMRLTRFTDYSLRVLIYLGQNNENRVTIHQISEAYDISKNHLMKVVSNLTRLQFVAAQRGPGGGIMLNRSPEDISLDEVIGNTEKHLREIPSPKNFANNKATADNRLSGFLNHALQAYLAELGRFTLADVLEPKSEVIQLLKTNEQAA